MGEKQLHLLCWRSILSFVMVVLLQGCVSDRGGEASPEYLRPSVGIEPVNVSDFPDFQSYAKSVAKQLEQHRVPFNPQQAELEIERAAPAQFDPAPECEADKPRGIIILVHGLSDTAFSMHDLGAYFSAECYIARSILLPGHGTRAGDLLTTDLSHWQNTISALIAQASAEHQTILVGGFSLGAVLTLISALDSESPVDGVMAFSPAYSLSSYKLARLAPYLHVFKRWIDRGLPDDYLRYEAMPTRGVGETVKAMKLMRRKLREAEGVEIPWLLVQSMDDAVTVPDENMSVFKTYAHHPLSRVINFHTGQKAGADPVVTWLPGGNVERRVLGITHLGVHISPDNMHYGPKGDYRNCGQTAPRDPAQVKLCLESEEVWYGLWNKPSPPELPTARGTFNPNFNLLTIELSKFLDSIDSEI